MGVLETRRLLLEPWDVRHRPLWREMCLDPEVMRYIGTGQTWDSRQADEFLDDALVHWQEHGFGWRSVLEKPAGAWLGFVGLNYPGSDAVEISPDEVEIGWWITRRAWGQGYATEGAAALGDEGFEQVGLDRIVARLQTANVASARVAEKIGMRLERETTGRYDEPVLVYTLDRGDWRRPIK
ncbi:MAG: GNAT family N-acetyltransferase [Actinomycetota bacterium]|nr:GNAT family N-acetyltransferase [Actinomycetota bacterium]